MIQNHIFLILGELSMAYFKTTCMTAVLAGGILACSGTDVTSTNGSNVLPLTFNSLAPGNGGRASARMLTTEEAVAFLEAEAARDTSFLDIGGRFSDGHKTYTASFRTLLNQLRTAQDPNTVAKPIRESALNYNMLLDPSPPQIQSQYTLAQSGYPGQTLALGASMDVYYTGTATLGATQTITLTGILPTQTLPYTKPSSASFPWTVAGTVQYWQPGNYTASTAHRVTSTDGDANAVTSYPGTVYSPPN